MSGLDLLDALKTKRPTWPAIAMSGSHNDGAEREALRLGARAFLHKPFDPQSLLDAITLALA
jgi:two-component system response regulator FixJ